MEYPDPMVTAAEKALLSSLGIGKDEKTLLVFDDSVPEIAQAFELAAKKNALSLTMRRIGRTARDGEDPDPETCAMMLDYPVIVCPTYHSLTHCSAMRECTRQGARGATLPGITNELFLRGLQAEKADLKRRTGELFTAFRNHSNFLVRSAAGTHLSFTLKKHKFFFDCAELDKPGTVGNLPGGEIFIAPDEGSAEGTIVLDGSIASFAWHDGDKPAFIDVSEGRAVTFSGERALKLHETLFEAGEEAFLLAEFGIGCNPFLNFTGQLLGDEKLAGTVHFAFGNNRSFGGNIDAPVHIDGLVFKPDVIADGTTIMKEGKLCPLN